MNGKYIASVRYRNSPIQLDDKGMSFFEVPSKDALTRTYKAIIKEVEAGEWDQLLQAKIKLMKQRAPNKA